MGANLQLYSKGIRDVLRRISGYPEMGYCCTLSTLAGAEIKSFKVTLNIYS